METSRTDNGVKLVISSRCWFDTIHVDTVDFFPYDVELIQYETGYLEVLLISL